MARKSVPFNKKGIEKLPNDKPAVYKILTKGGKNNYTGVAQRGRLQERLAEHLPGTTEEVPGARVVVQQTSTIAEARQREAKIIKQAQPKYNEQGK